MYVRYTEGHSLPYYCTMYPIHRGRLQGHMRRQTRGEERRSHFDMNCCFRSARVLFHRPHQPLLSVCKCRRNPVREHMLCLHCKQSSQCRGRMVHLLRPSQSRHWNSPSRGRRPEGRRRQLLSVLGTELTHPRRARAIRVTLIPRKSVHNANYRQVRRSPSIQLPSRPPCAHIAHSTDKRQQLLVHSIRSHRARYL